MAEKDYSGTPLWKKLGLKPSHTLFVGSAPYPMVRADLRGLFEEFPPATGPHGADIWLFFSTSRHRLAETFPAMAAELPDRGALWVAWPKKASALNAELGNDLDFQTVQRVGLDAGLVDNKSCSIDGDWQALRFVRRVKDRRTG